MLKGLCAVAVGCAAPSGCAADAEPRERGGAALELVAAPLGAAVPRVNGAGWKVMQGADFNFDGMADVLWNDAERNLIAVWLMDGNRLLAPGPVIPGPLGDGWVAASAADFNHDGMADVLWNNPELNLMSIWLMDGSRLLAPGPLIPGPLGDGWVAVQNLFDLNRDNMADVVWNNPEQNLMAVWLMEGSQLLAPGPLIPGPIGDGWKAVAVGDTNFDGMGDVVWNNPEQNLMAVWLMEGSQLLAPGPLIPGPIGDGWKAVAVGDTNFDGMGDVVWNNPEQNLMAVWLMEGSQLLAPGPLIPGPIGDGWKAVAVGDTNFDGMGDVVWNNPEQNLMAVWLMEGSQLLAPGPLIPGPLGDGWSVVTANDFSGDGEADVLWTDGEHGLMAIWLMEGSQLLAPGPVIPGPLGGGWAVRTAGDTNFDSMADAMWQAEGTNLMAIWLMEGSRLLAPGPLIPGPP
ncbi:hypothetical protein BE08_24950 [Sorangium cellulosum]|uniref:VCBS repeat-containing protein n=1 Tax=Sorangium cellulosum TaxID=56 RepID=A0A150PIV9_SORCE|nr:hypothetical protein BE08_24950 [Sorangium cellulosum]